jgi:hypothetical protein
MPVKGDLVGASVRQSNGMAPLCVPPAPARPSGERKHFKNMSLLIRLRYQHNIAGWSGRVNKWCSGAEGREQGWQSQPLRRTYVY